MTSRQQQRHVRDPLVDDEPAQELDELDFEEEASSRPAGEKLPQEQVQREQTPQRTRDAGLTGASHPGEEATLDDLTPETLLPEDGARSPSESGDSVPADSTLTKAKKDEIGGGQGLDEAELGRVDPLDGKPWTESD